ncbi:MAG: VOC family protein [Gammaproteobacteria bacterium]
MRFHHVGYAVADIQTFLDEHLVPLFAPEEVSGITDDPIQKVRVCFARMQGGTTIELVAPLADGSPVDAIIDSPRGGLYHLCYEVDDLDGAIMDFRRKRYMPLGRPVPAAAFDNRRIVFMMTPQHDLIELLEAV